MSSQRGEIYFVNLNPVQGREQSGQRPVLVISSDVINQLPLVVTVIVGTKGENIPRDYPTNGTTILNSNDFQISMDKYFQVNYQLKAPLSPQPPYPHCVEKGGETHF